MKKIVIVVAALTIHTSSYQQIPARENSPTIFNGVGDFTNMSGQSLNINAALQNTNGLNFSTNKKVEGTPFFNDEWCWGFIRFPNGAILDSIQLRYNALNNELHFRDGEKEYYLNEGYSEFVYAEAGKAGHPKVKFRNGFPVIGKNTFKTNYNVLAGSDFLLLKSITKDFHEVKSIDGQTFYRISDKEVYYVYNTSDSSLTKIRKGVQQLEADFPKLKSQISSICAKENLKCKSEADLIRLVSNLSAMPDRKKAF